MIHNHSCHVADGLIASRGKRKCSPCQQDCVPGGSTSNHANREGPSCKLVDDSSQSGKTDVYSGPNLPEDMWHHIHSLMHLKDAARAACLSQSFRCSWKRHPNLILSRDTLGWDVCAPEKETARDFRMKIDHILRNHSGTGVRKLSLRMVPNYNAEDRDSIDRWLQFAVTPAIEELTLTLSADSDKYKFPCTLLSNGIGDSLRHGLIASRGKRKCSPCQQDCVPGGSTSNHANREGPSCKLVDDSSQSGKTDVYSGPNLPEDMWHHIHSLMHLKDAARAACLSQSFRCSWKRHPNLILSRDTLGWDVCAPEKETARDFRMKIDHILRNHSGTGVRKLSLRMVPNYNAEDRDSIDRWLQFAVTPAIEELTLTLSADSDKYKFPCTLLSNGIGDSLRRLYLADCFFHPSSGLCCLRSLTKLELYNVHIMGDELWSLLSKREQNTARVDTLTMDMAQVLADRQKLDEQLADMIDKRFEYTETIKNARLDRIHTMQSLKDILEHRRNCKDCMDDIHKEVNQLGVKLSK
uniref:Uncharacterized protein n=1 Tax=Avena sativa TaxID=4498 RepID=A0ACD6AS85_AVESA